MSNKPMVMVSCETLQDLHMAAYDHDHVKYPATGSTIKAAQEEAARDPNRPGGKLWKDPPPKLYHATCVYCSTPTSLTLKPNTKAKSLKLLS